MCSASKNRARKAHRAAAQSATQRLQERARTLPLTALAAFAAFAAFAHTTHAQTRARVSFDGERALAHVRKLVEFGPRPAGSDALKRARDYIRGELKSYGLKVATDEFKAETPAGERRMANVSAEIEGAGGGFVVIASHYDTKLYKDFRFVGANDGGSSTGALLEIARVLASAPRGPVGYRLVFFDGEEATCAEWDECGREGSPDNTYGSRRYVARLRERGELKNLRALVLLDMMGYEKLSLGRDTMSTPWLVDVVWKTAAELGYGREFASRSEEVGGDDHAPFLDAGVPSLDIIQLNSYPFWHRPEDTLDKLSARSLRAVGEVVLASLPRIEDRLRGISDKRFEPVKTEKSEGVIIPAEHDAAGFCRDGSRACGRWTPNAEDVSGLERRMDAYLKTAAGVTPKILRNLSGYKRQYIGFLVNGRKKIRVHSFSAAWGEDLDWHKSVVTVFDGGDDFFDVTYDVGSETFSDFATHGYA